MGGLETSWSEETGHKYCENKEWLQISLTLKLAATDTLMGSSCFSMGLLLTGATLCTSVLACKSADIYLKVINNCSNTAKVDEFLIT